MEWISVNDRLPNEDFEFVLVAVLMYDSKDYGTPWVAHKINGEWATVDGTRFEKEFGFTVTHWTKLPENPNGKQKFFIELYYRIKRWYYRVIVR